MEQVQTEVQQRRGVDAQPSRWSGADEYARGVYGHELDVVASSYLPWLVEQLTVREGELQHVPLVGAMDVSLNAVDWDWVPLLDQRLFPCFLLHPSQPHKGHMAFDQRNMPWAECFTGPLQERLDGSLHWTLGSQPLFRTEYALPTLSALLTWLQQHLTHPLPLDRLLARAEVVPSAVEWMRRGAVAAMQLTYLVACYGHVLQLSRLEPHLEIAADDMRQLVGVDRRYATLQAVDCAWCEQQVPAVEQLVSEWLSSPAMQTEREAWMKERQAWDSSHLAPYTVPAPPPLLHGTDPTGLVVELNNESFASVVFDPSKDVVVGLWEDDTNDFTRNLGLCCRVLLPAIARLLRRTPASASPSSLVLAVKATRRGESSEPMRADWMEPQLHRSVVQGLGALVMYQSGVKPHPDNYAFYSLYEDAYTEPLATLVSSEVNPSMSYGDFKQSLRPPTLSALCRWLHSAMRGRDFELRAADSGGSVRRGQSSRGSCVDRSLRREGGVRHETTAAGR